VNIYTGTYTTTMNPTTPATVYTIATSSNVAPPPNVSYTIAGQQVYNLGYKTSTSQSFVISVPIPTAGVTITYYTAIKFDQTTSAITPVLTKCTLMVTFTTPIATSTFFPYSNGDYTTVCITVTQGDANNSAYIFPSGFNYNTMYSLTTLIKALASPTNSYFITNSVWTAQSTPKTIVWTAPSSYSQSIITYYVSGAPSGTSYLLYSDVTGTIVNNTASKLPSSVNPQITSAMRGLIMNVVYTYTSAYIYATTTGPYSLTPTVVTLPDGYYNVAAINAFIHNVCVSNGLFFTTIINGVSANVYLVEVVENDIQYSVNLNLYNLQQTANKSFKLPTYPPNSLFGFLTTTATPQVTFLNGFGELLGFPDSVVYSDQTPGASIIKSGITQATGVTIMSPITPNLNIVDSYVIGLNVVRNKFSNGLHNIVSAIPLTAGLGTLITTTQSSSGLMVDTIGQFFSSLIVTLYSQELKPVYLIDSGGALFIFELIEP
jgi:hypothetical protein